MRPMDLKVLSDEEIQAVHDASVCLLAEHGVYLHSDEVIRRFGDGGAQVDGRVVRMPPRMVEEALDRIPSRFTVRGRTSEHDMDLGAGRVYAGSGHNAVFVLDGETGERREATKRDVGTFARISDGLKDIDFVGIQVMPQDVPPRASLLHGLEACFHQTLRHIYVSPEAREVTEAIVAMCRAVAGHSDLLDRSPATCQLSSTSPLIWTRGAAESVVVVCEAGMPLSLLPEPYAGVSAPVTSAGHLLVHNAEVLSGVVLSQLIRKRAPVIYGGAWTNFDMREANVCIGTPERLLMSVAGAQMADFYRMPSHCIGPDSDSHAQDEQTAWEKAFSAMVAMASGTDLMVNAGMFATGLTVSYEQLILDAEMIGLMKRYLRGFEVNPSTLAAELIREVGHQGNFLGELHTVEQVRKGIQWEPMVSCRRLYENWREDGARDVVQVAREKARTIAETHRVPPLPPEMASTLRAIVEEFERVYP